MKVCEIATIYGASPEERPRLRSAWLRVAILFAGHADTVIGRQFSKRLITVALSEVTPKWEQLSVSPKESVMLSSAELSRLPDQAVLAQARRVAAIPLSDPSSVGDLNDNYVYLELFTWFGRAGLIAILVGLASAVSTLASAKFNLLRPDVRPLLLLVPVCWLTTIDSLRSQWWIAPLLTLGLCWAASAVPRLLPILGAVSLLVALLFFVVGSAWSLVVLTVAGVIGLLSWSSGHDTSALRRGILFWLASTALLVSCFGSTLWASRHLGPFHVLTWTVPVVCLAAGAIGLSGLADRRGPAFSIVALTLGTVLLCVHTGLVLTVESAAGKGLEAMRHETDRFGAAVQKALGGQ